MELMAAGHTKNIMIMELMAVGHTKNIMIMELMAAGLERLMEFSDPPPD